MPAASRSGNRKRLVCVVEGKGEVEAVPCLCSKLLSRLAIDDWFVDPHPIRQPRSKLVNERERSPKRHAHEDGLERAIRLALTRPADGILVLCDSDDDCPAIWGPSAQSVVSRLSHGVAVMVIREFEAWLLVDELASPLINGRPIDGLRDVKSRLRQFESRYKPTTHQLKLSRKLNVDKVWEYSDSFDKLVRAIATIAGIQAPKRPGSAP